MARFGSGAALARELGKTRQAVQQAEKAGRITRTANGLYDLDAAAIQYRLHTDPEQSRRATAQVAHAPADGVIADDWNGRRNRAEALRAELELQQRAGQLVDAAKARAELEDFLAKLASRLNTIPARISAEFGVDPQHALRLRTRLAEEINRARSESIDADRTSDDRQAA